MSQHWDIAYRAFQDLNADLIAADLDARRRAQAIEAMLNLCSGYLESYREQQDAQLARWQAIEAAANKENAR